MTPLPIELTALISNYLPRLIYGIKQQNGCYYILVLNLNETGNIHTEMQRVYIGRMMVNFITKKPITMMNDRYLIRPNDFEELLKDDIFSDAEEIIQHPGKDLDSIVCYNETLVVFGSENLCLFNSEHWQIPDDFRFYPGRRSTTTCYYHDELYVIGGEDVDGDNCECFNTITKKWKLCASMPTQRSHAISVVCNNEIMVMAGRNKRGMILDSVDIYSPISNVWKTADWTLPSTTNVFLYGQFISYNQQLIVSNAVDYWILDMNQIKKVWIKYKWP